ncbi:methyltransferase [Marivirga sp. S37H4]|uniref:tRNA1(Val) (adenine(37)-N6)-methyltransferase n=1 Tax=Marivirga aurantiaca TaxID=2802615 RepID=A0A934WV82_9BACT|nr:methyltransferase [Marivirga aurantiaca]MBK6263654.1 methyltransferase [Marivirga aurantiaca]
MSIFQFKQFTLTQSDSAAKLTTDATIFGAWMPVEANVQNALEIGAGTGVLSLMLAQRFPFEIEAVEIDEKAFLEAKRNFLNSPWSNRLTVVHQDFKRFNSNKKYDLIFSNPPFFTKNLQSPKNAEKNTAYHTNQLPLQALSDGINEHLTKDGTAYIMLPTYEMGQFEKLMKQHGLLVTRSATIHHNHQKAALRIIHAFSRSEKKDDEIKKLYVRDENSHFHPDYIQLLKPFLTIF